MRYSDKDHKDLISGLSDGGANGTVIPVLVSDYVPIIVPPLYYLEVFQVNLTVYRTRTRLRGWLMMILMITII